MTRANPWRRVAGADTRTWLPEDASKYPRNNKLHWSRAEKQLEPGGPWYKSHALAFPDGKVVFMQDRLGKGHWTTAYLGDDGWVYLLTKEEGLRDPAKDILTEFTEDMKTYPESIHFPWVEKIGEVRLSRSGVHSVYRMPQYEPIPVGSANAKVARKLSKISDVAFTMRARLGVKAATQLTTAQKKDLQVLAVNEAVGIPDSVKAAVSAMADYMANWGDGWQFEFPKRNLMQDADGNLVLLDVIFDADALWAQRAKKWGWARGNPGAAGHQIREDQQDGFRIDTGSGFIQYRPLEGVNEIWWIESRKRGGGAELMDLMMRHHPADTVAWGATSESGQAFRKKWHAAHPGVADATEGDRVPFEGQFDPYDQGHDETDDEFDDAL